MEVEIVDLRDFPMPFFDEVASNAWAPSKNEVAALQKKVAEFDGYYFVTLSTTGRSRRVQERPRLGAISRMEQELGRHAGRHHRNSAAPSRSSSCAWSARAAIGDLARVNPGEEFMAVWKDGKDLTEIGNLQQGVKDLLDQLAW